jgi:hypothetical protein
MDWDENEKRGIENRGHTLMLVLVEMVQTTSVETGRTTNDAVHLVSLVEQELGPEIVSILSENIVHNKTDSQIRPILTSDACQKGRVRRSRVGRFRLD